MRPIFPAEFETSCVAYPKTYNYVIVALLQCFSHLLSTAHTTS